MKKRSRLIILVAIVAALAVAAVLYFTLQSEPDLIVYNWYDYIDKSVIEQFEKETGLKVKYVNFTTCEEMYTKMTTGGAEYDVVVPSDYIIERMIREGMLAKIDYEKAPNAKANLLTAETGAIDMWNLSYDVGNVYSVPYMWGTVGILYNPAKTGEDITSWSSIYDPKYQNDVFMLNSIRDSMGVALKYLGYSLNDHSEAALSDAANLLIKQKNDGIVQGYMVDEVKDKMVAGEAAMAVMWSGDAMYAIAENDTLKYVVPSEGSNVWVDALVVPANSKHYDAAMKFIDFMCRPDIAQLNYEEIHYASPIAQVVADLPEEEAANPAVNPGQEVIANCEFFHDIMDYMEIYDKYWNKVRN